MQRNTCRAKVITVTPLKILPPKVTVRSLQWLLTDICASLCRTVWMGKPPEVLPVRMSARALTWARRFIYDIKA